MIKSFFRPNISRLRRCMCTIPPGSNPDSKGDRLAPRYKPSELQKFILVWTKKYKNKQEIPPHVSPEIIERSQSEARIKISNMAILLTVLASVGAVIAGKAAAKRGESVHQMNLDWHKKYESDFKEKEETKK